MKPEAEHSLKTPEERERARAVIDHRMAALISLLPAVEPWQTGIINQEIQELKILMKELA